jgi:hypothetical protein
MALLAALCASCANLRERTDDEAPTIEREARPQEASFEAPPAPRAPNPPLYHWDPCVVLAVGHDHIVLNKGSADGMRQGDQLMVRRNKRGVAIVRVVQVETQRSIAVMTNRYRAAPEIGDTLEPHYGN